MIRGAARPVPPRESPGESGRRGSAVTAAWSGPGLGAGARPRPGDPVPHGNGTAGAEPGMRAPRGTLLVAERRQELADGLQVGRVDFRKGRGLHGNVGSIHHGSGMRPRDTMSRGDDRRSHGSSGLKGKDSTENDKQVSGR